MVNLTNSICTTNRRQKVMSSTNLQWLLSFFVGILGIWRSGKVWMCCWAELGTLQAATEVRTRTVLHPEQKSTQLPHPLKLSPSSLFSSLQGATFRITLLPAVMRLYISSQTALTKLECEQ